MIESRVTKALEPVKRRLDYDVRSPLLFQRKRAAIPEERTNMTPASQRVDYKRYLASREWRLKRRGAIELAHGICQRCGSAKISHVHHKSYERIGDERPTDLMGVCAPCHQYLSAERDEDPAIVAIWGLINKNGLRPCPPGGSKNYPYWFEGGRSVMGLVLEITPIPATAANSYEKRGNPVIILSDEVLGSGGVAARCDWKSHTYAEEQEDEKKWRTEHPIRTNSEPQP